jgi:hypothetical protein
MCVCVYPALTDVFAGMCTHKGQRSILIVTPQGLSTLFVETGFLAGPELTKWAMLAWQRAQGSPVSASLVPGLQVCASMLGFLHGSRDVAWS